MTFNFDKHPSGMRPEVYPLRMELEILCGRFTLVEVLDRLTEIVTTHESRLVKDEALQPELFKLRNELEKATEASLEVLNKYQSFMRD